MQLPHVHLCDPEVDFGLLSVEGRYVDADIVHQHNKQNDVYLTQPFAYLLTYSIIKTFSFINDSDIDLNWKLSQVGRWVTGQVQHTKSH